MKASAKTLLLADVGGTNTRVAMARGGAITGVQHFENRAFSDVYAVLAAYIARSDISSVEGCSVAMAGPVRGGQGRLTNCDWDISTGRLQQELAISQVCLMNDLTALGHALPTLAKGSLRVFDQPDGIAANGQSLVIGIGTGFNLCPVLHQPDGTVQCVEVEMGHAALSAPLRDALDVETGGAAADFPTLEHLFSGDGLASFHHARSGNKDTAKDIVQMSEEREPEARQTLDAYTKLLGLLCGELALQYMPMSGIYFAGSVARGVLGREFLGNLTVAGTGKVSHLVGAMPKAIILDDAAALGGCLAVLGQDGLKP